MEAQGNNIESGKNTVMVFHLSGKDQHSPELPPVQDETEYRGQQALPAPQAQATQLLAGVGLDPEDGGQHLPVPQTGGGGGCGWGPRGTAGAGGHDVDVGLTAAPPGY
jgi:hypothetical protein